MHTHTPRALLGELHRPLLCILHLQTHRESGIKSKISTWYVANETRLRCGSTISQGRLTSLHDYRAGPLFSLSCSVSSDSIFKYSPGEGSATSRGHAPEGCSNPKLAANKHLPAASGNQWSAAGEWCIGSVSLLSCVFTKQGGRVNTQPLLGGCFAQLLCIQYVNIYPRQVCIA